MKDELQVENMLAMTTKRYDLNKKYYLEHKSKMTKKERERRREELIFIQGNIKALEFVLREGADNENG